MTVPRILALATIWCIPVLFAVPPDASPPDATSLAKELDALELKQKLSKESQKNAMLGQLQTALTNGAAAASLYSQAVESVHFRGKKNKGEAFLDWKKSHADLLRSNEMQTALLLHLRYLLLSIQRKGLENPASQLPALTAYLSELIEADKLFSNQKSSPSEAKDLLDKPLDQSVITQWLGLGDWLPDEQSWALRPGDVAGILENNVRPVMREQKDPQITATWDLQLQVEANRITTGRSEFQADQFNSVTRPGLLFSRAQDMVAVGLPNRGVLEMFALVKTYPTHPDFATWVARIRELIKSPSDQTSPQ